MLQSSADFAQLISDAGVPGISLAIIRRGQIETLVVAGQRNVRDERPVDYETIFDAASLSKPVFAYAVLQLIDAGVLTLDTRLHTHVPDYVVGDLRAHDITVRHVLSHSSGLPNWRTDTLPLKTYFRPGERFSYSGEGFVWLQRVLETVTGESVGAIMKRLVFEPLAMGRSSFTWQSAFSDNFADPHDASLVPDAKKKPATMNAAASLQTTSSDYANFLCAVLSGTRLSAEIAKQWTAPQVALRHNCVQCLTNDLGEQDMQVSWGLGWGLEPANKTFFQWGDNDRGRFKAFTMGSVEEKVAVVVFTNSFNGMSIMPEIVESTLKEQHPAFDWLNYPRFRQ